MCIEKTSEVGMTDLVDVATLRALQNGLSEMTGASAILCDPDGSSVTEPAGESGFCKLLRSTASGREALESALARAARLAQQAERACRTEGYAGLVLCSAAIRLGEGVVGTLVAGQRPLRKPTAKDIGALAETHGLSAEELASSVEAMEPWTEEGVAASLRFLDPLAKTLGELCHLSNQLRHRVDELAAVYEMTSMLAGRTDLQEILDLSVGRLVEVMDLRAAGVRLLDEESGELRIAAVSNLSSAYLNKGPLVRSKSPVDEAALSGQTVYVADVQNDPRTVYQEDARREGLVSALVAPMICHGKVIGAMRAYTDRPRTFTPFDRALLEGIASQVAAAVLNARLHREMRLAERLDRQVKLASEVQRRMIPAEAPETSVYSFGCIYEPSSELAGDFYDFFEFPNGDIGLVIADVVGKGVPASLMMASSRAVIRSYANVGADVGSVVAGVNHRLCKDTQENEFVTAFYGVLSADGRRLTYCNAGHEPMLLLRDGRIHELSVHGSPLGIDCDSEFAQSIQLLEAGDVLVLLTDGVLEAVNYDDVSFGRERLHASIQRHAALPARFLAKQILWDVRRFSGLASRHDDITMVVTRVQGGGA
ncbi:MAG: SpoIIE family protein phosphatase [Planctomycetota bacterium]|nr:SpoIIE family protein phosphatase [Planctomycetota bacterium]